MASAAIIEPTGESDTPLKFTAGLILGIPIDCELHDLEDMRHVRIQVCFHFACFSCTILQILILNI